MGREFLSYAAVFLLLSVGGSASSYSDSGVRILRQDTVGPGHWHKYESLFWLYPNTDLDLLNPTDRDAGYFSIKRPTAMVNSVNDEAIFKIRIHPNGLISLNDGNLTSCHPTTHLINTPSFLPLHTSAELAFAEHYDTSLRHADSTGTLLAAKQDLQTTLRHINHCNTGSDAVWAVLESHPELGTFAPIVTTAVSSARWVDVDGQVVDSRVLHVMLSHNIGGGASAVDSMFDILYTMDPTPSIRFINIPDALIFDYDSVPNYPLIIAEAGNPLLVMKQILEQMSSHNDPAEQAPSPNTIQDDLPQPTPSPTPSKLQPISALASAIAKASSSRPRQNVTSPVSTPHHNHPTYTFVPVSATSVTHVTHTLRKLPVLTLQSICFGSSHYCPPTHATPGPLALALWSLFWVLWACCMGLYTYRIVQYVYARYRGRGRIVLGDEEVIVMSESLDQVFTLSTPAEADWKQPLLSAISEKEEEE